MKTPLRIISALIVMSLLSACSNEPEEAPTPEPIGGRNAELVTYVSGDVWFPATTGILLINSEDTQLIRLSANSSANKGFQKRLLIDISDEDLEVPISGMLDYWENEHPVTVNSTYKEFRDFRNRNANIWRGNRFNLAGIRINGIETEDGVRYASGEFFMNSAPGDLRPAWHEITGLFNNVRVFSDASEMEAYFERVSALELTRD